MKAIVVDKNSADGLDYSIQKKIFEENGIEFVLEDCQTEDEIIEKCKDADALLVIYRQITPRIMDALEHCKVILRYGIGYDVIDVKAATERGIKVCNSPVHCLDEVATHTIAMILAMERQLVFYNDLVKRGQWLANAGFGESMRHGPHQGAQKSTSTGFSAARTSRSKLSCVTVKTDILKTPFASDDIASPVYIHRICQNACSFRDNITILWVWIKLVSASSPSPDEQASAHLRSQRSRARV